MRRAFATAVTSALILACGATAAPQPPPPQSAYIEERGQPPQQQALLATAPPATTPPPPVERAPTTGAACAIDAPWIAQVAGKGVMSTVMRFDGMRRRGAFGPLSPITTYNDFTSISRTSEEKYEWPAPVPGERNPDVVILRNASGAVPNGYGAPVSLASGVLEHPPGKDLFPGMPRRFSLFVFPDRTWVRVEGSAMTARVRELFAVPGTPPPLPTADADVAWELCGPLDQNDIDLPFDRWTIEGDRVAVRLFASRQEGELVYAFLSPTLAASAANEQARSCTPGRCDWITSSSVEGPLVRYGVKVRTSPTSGRTVLGIADKTMPLPSPPPLSAPAAPGMPPSGVYQEFREVKADSCPTHSAGKPFPSDMTPLLMTHRQGKTFTNLHSNDPRAPGIMTGGPMNDFELTPGKVMNHSITHLCQPYRIERTMTLVSVTGDTIRTREVTRHIGTTKGCEHTNLPDNCTTDVETTWKLARKSCDAACDATIVGREPQVIDAAPRLNVKCICP